MDSISSIISSVASNPKSTEAFNSFVDSAKDGSVSSSDVTSLVSGLAGQADGGKGFMSILGGALGGGGAVEGGSGGVMSMLGGLFGGSGGAGGSGSVVSGVMSFFNGDTTGMVKGAISYLFPPAGIGMAVSDGLKSFLGENNPVSGLVDGAVGVVSKGVDKVKSIFGF